MKTKTADILRDVSAATGIPASDIVGRCRKPKFCDARNFFFYECLRLSGQSASCIAQRYGFHHATLMQGAAKHAQLHNAPAVTGFNYSRLRHRMTGEAKARAKALREMAPEQRAENIRARRISRQRKAAIKRANARARGG